MIPRGSADEDLRHCLTVVSGYLGLLLEEKPGPVGPEHWTWLERAQQAAARAVAICDAQGLLQGQDEPITAPPKPAA